jgi:hypothetical protein
MPSIRMEIFKTGQEEFKYLKLLDAAAAAGNADAVALVAEIKEFLGDTLKYDLHNESYDRMKLKIAELLQKGVSA